MTKPSCEQIRIAAIALVDGDEPLVDVGSVKQHLAACESCRVEIKQLDVSNLLPADLERSTIHSDLWSQVREGLEKKGSQENSVTEQATVSPRTQTLASPMFGWMLAAAATLLLCAGVGFWWMTTQPSTQTAIETEVEPGTEPLRETEQRATVPNQNLIVLAPLAALRKATKPLPPFHYEARADVIAIAVMGKTKRSQGQDVISMDLAEVLKGRQKLGQVESPDDLVPFGCTMPKNAKTFSEMYKEGERVAVYLKKIDGSWSTLQMTHLTASYEPQWKSRVTGFVDVLLASEAEDPQQRYAQLLVINDADNGTDKHAPRRGLSEASYYALLNNPDPRAAEFVREMLIASVRPKLLIKKDHFSPEQLAMVDGTPYRKNIATNREIEKQIVPNGVFSPPPHNSPFEFAQLLARMHDQDSVVWAIMHMASIPADARQRFMLLLPDMCQGLDDKTMQFVKFELSKYANSYKGDKQDAYYRTLLRTQQSIDQLLEN